VEFSQIREIISIVRLCEVLHKCWRSRGSHLSLFLERFAVIVGQWRVSWTRGIGLRIHSAPGTGTSWYAVIPEGTQVAIACQTGYASDAYVDTGTNDQVAASC
jgi:hypothetical protein